jgi:hypothetical protein
MNNNRVQPEQKYNSVWEISDENLGYGHYTDKKENKILLIYKESEGTSCLLIYDEIFAHFLIY